MQEKSKSKAPKGVPSIRLSNGVYQIRWTMRVDGLRKEFVISTGLRESSENRIQVESLRARVHSDLISGNFPVNGYRDKYRIGLEFKSDDDLSPRVTLLQVFEKFCEYQRSQVEASTYKGTYLSVLRVVQEIPYSNLSDADKVSRWVIENKPPKRAKRIINMLKQACEYAKQTNVIHINPFVGLSVPSTVNKFNPDPFTRSEKALILETLRRESRAEVAIVVEFLFRTGCRQSEAFGLQWRDVKEDHIVFQRGIVQGKEKKGLKTQEMRVFPLNQGLRDLLQKARELAPEGSQWVFNYNGKHWRRELLNAYWLGRYSAGKFYPGIVTMLADKGLISHYRSIHSARDTFITECLNGDHSKGIKPIPHKQVANWVGNSEAIIMKHYSGLVKTHDVPDFF